MRDRPNRFDCVLEVPAFDEALAREYLMRWGLRQPLAIDLARWARRARGKTGAQLQEVCRLAVVEAIEEHLSEDRGSSAAERLTITDAHMRRAFAKLPRKSRRAVGFTAQDEEDEIEVID